MRPRRNRESSPRGGAGFEMLMDSKSPTGGTEYRQRGDREQPQRLRRCELMRICPVSYQNEDPLHARSCILCPSACPIFSPGSAPTSIAVAMSTRRTMHSQRLPFCMWMEAGNMKEAALDCVRWHPMANARGLLAWLHREGPAMMLRRLSRLVAQNASASPVMRPKLAPQFQ
jgi:hypothetical protein